MVLFYCMVLFFDYDGMFIFGWKLYMVFIKKYLLVQRTAAKVLLKDGIILLG